MEKYVLEALCLMGETAYSKERMLKRYQEMIQDEGSTLFELWHKDEGTVNHGWTGGPLTIMGRYYAGVYPVSRIRNLRYSSFRHSGQLLLLL